LLNTITALNPDKFASTEIGDKENPKKPSMGAMRWINPILAPSDSRETWEAATTQGTNEAAELYSPAQSASSTWHIKDG